MAFGFIPLAGLALGGIAGLINRRRRARQGLQGITGSAFGRAMNTQPQGPATSTVTQAATSSPMPITKSGGGAGQTTRTTTPGANTPRPGHSFGGQAVASPTTPRSTLESQGFQQNAGDEASKAPTPGPIDRSNQIGGDPGMTGAEVGAAQIARSRRRNREQQATLSGAAVTR